MAVKCPNIVRIGWQVADRSYDDLILRAEIEACLRMALTSRATKTQEQWLLKEVKRKIPRVCVGGVSRVYISWAPTWSPGGPRYGSRTIIEDPWMENDGCYSTHYHGKSLVPRSLTSLCFDSFFFFFFLPLSASDDAAIEKLQ